MAGEGNVTVNAPLLMPGGELEYSIHTCGVRFQRQLKDVLGPHVDYSSLHVVPLFLRAAIDLVEFGPHVEAEKERLIQLFMKFANGVCAALQAQGFYADYTDPCSGLPALGERYTGFYPDVIGAQLLLRYDVISTGCCSLLTHPRWGTKVYPATLFTTASVDALVAAVEEAERNTWGEGKGKEG